MDRMTAENDKLAFCGLTAQRGTTTLITMETDAIANPAAGWVGPPRDIVFLAAPNVSSLEISGPAEAFAMAADKLREAGRIHSRPYRLHVLSHTDTATLGSTTGLSFNVNGSCHSYDGAIDTLLVVGGLDVWTGMDDPGLLDWVQNAARRSRRFGSICTGAFVLAAAGLLDGQRVTTHWFFCERLAREYPKVTVDPEPIFIRTDKLSTAAGVTSGIDLALALIEEDLGLEISLRIAHALVLYVRRPGWQSQFSSALALQAPTRLSFRDLPFWILENLQHRLTLQDLAGRVAMSPRNFSRVFAAEFGIPPLKFVTQLRTEMALRLLGESDRSREEIAHECGFGSLDAMSRALDRSRSASTD
jgi:transcriptional regulator GlxA family with amidase domain